MAIRNQSTGHADEAETPRSASGDKSQPNKSLINGKATKPSMENILRRRHRCRSKFLLAIKPFSDRRIDWLIPPIWCSGDAFSHFQTGREEKERRLQQRLRW